MVKERKKEVTMKVNEMSTSACVVRAQSERAKGN